MEIYQRGQAFVERDGDIEFGFTKFILRQNHDYFFATTKDRLGPTDAVDLEQLKKIPIPPDEIWPPFSSHYTRAPQPLRSDYYVKEPNLLHYGDTPVSLQLAQTIHEVEMCELLKRHPHPNVATYRGCVVDLNRIRGICFDKYKMTLAKRLEDTRPLDRASCLRGIEEGIRHLHSLGLVHNDINPTNVMVDEMDRPVLVDFDSCQMEGHKLGPKAGTDGWSLDGSEYAKFENDFYGLSKLQEFVGIR